MTYDDEREGGDSDSGDYDEFIASLSKPITQTDTTNSNSNRRGKRDKIKKKIDDIDTSSSLLGRVVDVNHSYTETASTSYIRRTTISTVVDDDTNSNEEVDSSELDEERDIAKERAMERRVEARRKSVSNIMGWSLSTPNSDNIETGDTVNTTPDPKPTTHDIDINDTLVAVDRSADPDPTARSIFDDAREFISFNPVMRIVIWLYSERKMVLLACSHLVATLIIWAHYAMIRYEQQEGTVPDDASRYTAKRIVPPFLFGSKHAILFQMALIPLTMSRYTIASLSTSKLNYYLPLNKSLRIHIYLGYTMIALSFLALFVFFAYLGILCNDGEDDACAALTSEIMITGIIICGLTGLMLGTAYYRNGPISYEVFYRVHYLFLVVYSLTIAHTVDASQRSGEKRRSQTFTWFIAPLLYYFCDYTMMWFNQKFRTRITSFTTIDTQGGSNLIVLTMQRPTLFRFQPGQYAFLRVGTIDKTWHPFSIASSPDSSLVEFNIEVFDEGSWTFKLWQHLKYQDTHDRMYIDLLGPYGTALVNDPSHTNILVVGSGTGIVPCISLLKQHTKKMLMTEPESYLIERSEHMKRTINVLGAQEDKDGSLAYHLVSTIKKFATSSNQDQDDDNEENNMISRVSSSENLRSSVTSQTVRESINDIVQFSCSVQEVKDTLLNHRHRSLLTQKAKSDLKKATFKATKAMYGSTILALLTLYGVTILGLGFFCLNLSWNFTSATNLPWGISVANLEVMTWSIHAIFLVCLIFIWNVTPLQAHIDVVVSLALVFLDCYYHQLKRNLSTGQVIILSLFNAYITFRLYQKSLEIVGHHTSKESVEHLRFVWTVRSVKMAEQLYSEISNTYEALLSEWGEEYTREVVDVSIYITDKDEEARASFRDDIKDTALYKSNKVFFTRPNLPQLVEQYVLNLIESRPAYSSTSVAFCGGPQLSRILNDSVSTIKLLAAATGHASHRLDFVSESYGGSKSTKKTAFGRKMRKSKTVTSVFDVSTRGGTPIVEYNSQRELMRDYQGREGSVLRFRGGGIRGESMV